MKKNRKLIALLCAMAMIFSVFGVFTVVNAEGEGIELSAVVADDGLSAEVTAKYVGLDGIASYMIALDVPADIVKNIPENSDNAEALAAGDKISKGITAVGNFDKENNMYYLTAAVMNDVKPENDIFAVFHLEFESPLTEPLTLTLQDDSYLSVAAGDEYGVSTGKIAASTLELPKYVAPTEAPKPTEVPTEAPTVDPNATPNPTKIPDYTRPPFVPDPTDVPAATDDPNATPKPTEVPITGVGIKLESETAADGKSATITAKYVGLEGIASYMIALNVPADIVKNIPEISDNADALAAGDKVSKGITAVGNFDKENNMYYLTAAVMNDVKPEDDIFAVFHLEFESELKDDLVLTLQDDSYLSVAAGDEYGVSTGKIPASFVIVDKYTTPVVTPEPTTEPTAKPEVPEYKLDDYLTDAQNEYLKNSDSTDITVKVTFTKDGKDVELKYGDDFEVFYDGELLTENQYNNYMNGYDPKTGEKLTGKQLADVASKLGYKFYGQSADGVKADLIEDGTPIPGDDKPLDPSSTPAPTVKPTNSPRPTSTPGATNRPGSSSSGNGNGYWYNDSNNKGNNGQIAGGLAAPSYSSGSATQFTDLYNVPWAQEAITGLAYAGIINGRTATTFDPEANITRAEFTKIMVGALNLQPEGTATFADSVGHWASSYIAVAAKRGLINGYSDAEFGPDRTITREEIAAIVYRAGVSAGKDFQASDATSFTDNASIQAYAMPAVTALVKAGIINGMGDGTFAPQANATRAQAAVMIWRYMGTR